MSPELTFDDLRRAVVDIIAAEQIGTPVSLRIYLTIPHTDAPWGGWPAVLDELRTDLFEDAEGDVAVRISSNRQTVNLLMRFHDGRTTHWTLTRGIGNDPSISLLIVGNQGISRLEPTACELSPVPGDAADAWQALITNPSRERRPLPAPHGGASR